MPKVALDGYVAIGGVIYTYIRVRRLNFPMRLRATMKLKDLYSIYVRTKFTKLNGIAISREKNISPPRMLGGALMEHEKYQILDFYIQIFPRLKVLP